MVLRIDVAEVRREEVWVGLARRAEQDQGAVVVPESFLIQGREAKLAGRRCARLGPLGRQQQQTGESGC